MKRTGDDYGFIPDVNVSIHLNARRILGDTPTQEYFSLFRNKSFHDFTTKELIPFAVRNLLGNGLKFIVTPKRSHRNGEIKDTLQRFDREMRLKVFFTDPDLENDYIEPLRVNSEWTPESIPLEIIQRISNFSDAVRRTHIPRRGIANISSYQARLLQSIRENEKIIIMHADKNLGPVAVDTTDYINWALNDHLLDTSTYKQVSEDVALEAISELNLEIFRWCRVHGVLAGVSVDACRYIRHHTTKNRKEPYGQFYLLAKIHKVIGKSPMPTRPVCSDCASIVHPLGKWLDLVLQPIVKKQFAYFKDSFSLQRELIDLGTLPANASLIAHDAVSMYTNIDIDDCIERISTYLATILDKYELAAIVEALEIVMHNNRMSFGDLIFHQIRGVAMGMSPAPTIANLYVAIFELSNILPLLDKHLLFYKRFIDDGIAIWLHDKDPITDANNWLDFQSIINRHSGLQWTFVEPCKKLIYMDMTIQIENGLIVTSMYAKPMALYQYIPPNSCHPPGVLKGLVLGQILRIYQLCTKTEDIDRELRLFHVRLVDRGYQPDVLFPIFVQGVDNATNYLSLTPAQREARKLARSGNMDERVFFHVEYHPQNVTSKITQQLWRNTISSPSGKETLTQVKNCSGFYIKIKRLIVAYHRAPNLGNLLTYRKLSSRTGLKASSFIETLS